MREPDLARLTPLAREVLWFLRSRRNEGVRLREIARAVGLAHYMPAVSGAVTYPLRWGWIVKVSRGVYAAAIMPDVGREVAA